jgi:hypothetical protein
MKKDETPKPISPEIQKLLDDFGLLQEFQENGSLKSLSSELQIILEEEALLLELGENNPQESFISELKSIIIESDIIKVKKEEKNQYPETPLSILGNYLEWNTKGKTFAIRIVLWPRVDGRGVYDICLGVLNCGIIEETVSSDEIANIMTSNGFTVHNIDAKYGWGGFMNDDHCVIDLYGVRAEVNKITAQEISSLSKNRYKVMNQNDKLRKWEIPDPNDCPF